LLSLTKEMAAAKAQSLGTSEYDALLDQYEPGGRADDIDRIFTELEAFLPDLVGQIIERQSSETPPIRPQGPFPEEAQKRLDQQFMTVLGFDFNHGRLDVSAHPFCGGTPDDVRITTRYKCRGFQPRPARRAARDRAFAL
jgi:carboxypeptidase Taq